MIKYNDREEEKDINEQELQLTKSFMEKLGKNSLSLSDLEQSNSNNQQPNKTNWTPWILGGIGIVVVIIGIIWLVRRNNKSKE